MKQVGTLVGAAIVSTLVMSVWGPFVDTYGILGGIAAAVLIITPMWYMNHNTSLISQGNAFIDMGLAIGVAGIVKDIILQGALSGVQALPTLALVLLGGALGGIIADKIMVAQASSAKESSVESINTSKKAI